MEFDEGGGNNYGMESLETYEDYLDSQISETDMYYLEVIIFIILLCSVYI